ncbi:MAG: phosphohydrolase [Candidatus Altiarchaeales archaeon]|nr:MAG: phosphohydrolase [Candidatus Altiarchaeales archaeon]
MKRLCNRKLIKHSEAVSKNAVEIAERLLASGIDLDINSIRIGALLHDIGRCKSNGIDHGIKGAEILNKIPELKKYSRFCLTHIGAGLTKDEAIQLNLPPMDYLPKTIEEKVVAHADNITLEDRKVDISITIKKMEKLLGKKHPAIKRVKELNDYIESLMKKHI